jgi:hypothetical protein
VNAEFNWWLLIVGLAFGAGLVWLILADSNRRDADITEEELPVEAAWIAASVAETGRSLEPGMAEQVLRLHREYLAKPPPDDPDAILPDPFPAAEPAASPAAASPAAAEPRGQTRRPRTSVRRDDAGM